MGNRAQLQDTPFGYSSNLWNPVPLDMIFAMKDRNYGWGVRDDFTNYSENIALSTNVGYPNSEGNTYKTFEVKGGASAQCAIPSTTLAWQVPASYPIYSASGAAVQYLGSTYVPTPGQLVFTPTSTNDQANMQLEPGYNAGTCIGLFTPYLTAAGTSTTTLYAQGGVFFECRLAISALTTGLDSFFIGLCGAGAGATGKPAGATTFAGSNSSASHSMLGFGWLSGDPTGAVGLVWAKNSAAVQWQYLQGNTTGTAWNAMNLFTFGTASTGYTIMVNGAPVVPFGLGSFIKLGFSYFPATGIFTPYVNGIPFNGILGPNRQVTTAGVAGGLTTFGTTAYGNALWPADPMTFAAGYFCASAATATVNLDWYAAAQLQG